MFATIFALALPLLAVALPGGVSDNSQCDTGAVQCCNQVQTAGSPAAAQELGLLGIVLQDINVPIGLDCSPITAIGVGSGSNCANSPVCCQNNSFNGVIAIGCTPINVQL